MQEMHDDEIDLIDILRVLWQRKTLIIVITLVFALAAAGISLVLPKVYEVSTIIEPGLRPITDANGQIVNEMPVVSPETIKETILGGAYDTSIQQKLNIASRDYPKLKVATPKNTSLIKVSVESDNPAEAVAILSDLVQRVSSDVEEKLENEKKKILNEISLVEILDKSLNEKIVLVEKQVSDIFTKIQSLESDRQKSMNSRSSDAMSVLLYSNEIQNQQIYLNNLQEKLKDFKAQALTSAIRVDNLRLKLGMVKSTKVTKEPTVPEKPVKPKKTLIVALAGVLGLFGSMLLAFLLEAIKRAGGLSRMNKRTDKS